MKEWARITKDPSGKAFTKQNPDNGSQITTSGSVSLWLETNFDPRKPTYVFAPGWNDNPWTPDRAKPLTDALLAKYKNNSNVVIVDWSSLSNSTGGWFGGAGQGWFGQQPLVEASVTKQVGEAIAKHLFDAGVKNPSNVTLIGHSLGTFVAGAVANYFKNTLTSSLKVGEIVALDIAYGADPYDIDSSSRIVRPYTINSNLANITTSYTVSDLSGLPSIAGDNTAAARADRAYLVQYAKTDGYFPGWIFGVDPADTGAASTLYHTGVMGVYADLITKNITRPTVTTQLSRVNLFDKDGKPSSSGPFDGVVVAATPWKSDPGDLMWGAKAFMSPKAIGWASDYLNPSIYGSNGNDMMFFDRFDGFSQTSQGGVTLYGGNGRDVLISHQPDNKGIDNLYGGFGSDLFAFGFIRYGSAEKPYDDKSSIDFWGRGLDAYAVVRDFNRFEDRLQFAWSKSELGYQDGSTFSKSLVDLYGRGIAMHVNNDLIAYFPGMTSAQARDVLNDPTKTTYNTFYNLDVNYNPGDFDLFW